MKTAINHEELCSWVKNTQNNLEKRNISITFAV